MHVGDAGLTITIADTHSESAFFGAICVEKGYKHKAFVNKEGSVAVNEMKAYLYESKCQHAYDAICSQTPTALDVL